MLSTEPLHLTVVEAFEGTNVVRALREEPEATRLALFQKVAEVSDYIDAKKRLTTPEEYGEVVDYLTAHFRNFTLEDIRNVCQKMRAGQYFERLKLGEYVAAFEAYDQDKSEAAAYRATNLQRKQYEGEQAATVERLGSVTQLADLVELPDKRPNEYGGKWLSGVRSKLTHAQRQELAARDRERRNAAQ